MTFANIDIRRAALLCIAIVLGVPSPATSNVDPGCKTNPAVIRRCYSVRGTITVNSDNGPAFELGNSKRQLMIRPAPGSTRMLPNRVEAMFSDIRVYGVFGSYIVCPIPPVPPLIHKRTVCVDSASALAAFPAWIARMIFEQQKSIDEIDLVEESTYNGKQVFELYQGVQDSGNEHRLFTAGGKLICQFGGFVGHVTSGACDIQKIIYVRTLYQGEHK